MSERFGGLSRTDLALYLVALLLACGCVVGGVFALRHHLDGGDASAPSEAEQDRYKEVTDAAERMAMALLNIDYEEPEASPEAVQAAATGAFLDDYRNVTESVRQLVGQYEVKMTSQVEISAVSSVEEKVAKVLVATEGTVTNSQTGPDDAEARNFRLLITVELVDGEWLASDLVFVG